MNAMAQIGTAQRAPEIVIVNDGRPVESVSAKSRGATIAKYAGIALVPLFLGAGIGSMGKAAAYFNAGIDDAKFVVNDVKNVKKSLATINESLGSSKKLTDKEFAALIERFDFKETVVFGAKSNTLDGALRSEINRFYATAAEIKLMAEDHIAAARTDEKALGDARAATEKMTPPPEFAGAIGVRMGVLVANDEGRTQASPFGAQLVEIGPPYCQDGKLSSSGTCPDGAFETLSYRTAPGGAWQRGDFALAGNTSAGAAIAPGKVLVISPTPVFDALARGNEGTAAEVLYNKRLAALRKKVTEAIEAANALEGKLRPKANQSKRFTFFM
ncbi:MAG: hypothetical protein R3B06_21855 [Kofleriaceae bacterium]